MRTAYRALKLFLLFAVSLYFCSVGPTQGTAAVSRLPRIEYGQALALSDLDGDKLIDQARLDVSGAEKTIDLCFSTQRKPSVLRFSTRSLLRGSLVAKDIDNDGDMDLVWTNTIDPDEVVVWINDGVGRFQRSSSKGWAADFVINGYGITGVSGSTRDLGAGLSKAQEFDLCPSAIPPVMAPGVKISTRRAVVHASAGWLTIPPGRAPPLPA